jgi:hypothetical protein
MDEPVQTQTDMPVEEAPNDTPVQEQPQEATSQPLDEAPAEAPAEAAAPAQEVATAPEEEESYPQYQPIPGVAPIDFSQLPVDENNLIDPNALAQQINSRIAQAEQKRRS